MLVNPYRAEFKKIFASREKDIRACLGTTPRIEHFGSTAVFGLPGKGVIDILIGFKNKTQLLAAAKNWFPSDFFLPGRGKSQEGIVFSSRRIKTKAPSVMSISTSFLKDLKILKRHSVFENMKIICFFRDSEYGRIFKNIRAGNRYNMPHMHFSFKTKLEGEVGCAMRINLMCDSSRAQTFDHSAGMENVAMLVNKGCAIKIYGVCNAILSLKRIFYFHNIYFAMSEDIL